MKNEHRENEYRLIARTIDHLARHRLEQPSLDQLAAHIGLSPGQLQRLFSRWAGISPKRMLQYLTARAGREKLREAPSSTRPWRAGSPAAAGSTIISCACMP